MNIWQRLKNYWKSDREKGVILYSRETGIICYDIELLPDSEIIRQWPQQFLATDLTWYWESASRSASSDAMDAHLPARRPLTVLTSETVQALTDDLLDVDAYYERRDLVILGTDRTSKAELLQSAEMDIALENFIVREAGPIRIFITQVCDLRDQTISVPHQPIEVIENLLHSWGIDKNAIQTIRKYPKNNPYMVEGYVKSSFRTSQN